MKRQSLGVMLVLGLVAACGGETRGGAGPSYSTTPCADNCGNDVQCMTNCQNVGPNAPPLRNK
jgi:hypothetical protein